MSLDGATLSAAWSLPFAGMLLSVAMLPMAAPGVWHRHAGKIAVGWSAAFLIPCAARFGVDEAVHGLAHAALAEYLPFIILLTALFTAAGGIHVRGSLRGSPRLNTGLMALGALLASVMGTTGASMLLIRPLIRANAHRPNIAHVVIFFIFIVSNIGGALTPLGDPPLFLGFLQGVSFFWTTQHLLAPMLFLVACLLAVFYLLDAWVFRRELHRGAPVDRIASASEPVENEPVGNEPDGIGGAINLLPLAAIVGLVLMSGAWKSGVSIQLLGVDIELPQLLRDVGLILVTLLSLAITPRGLRAANDYSWAPMKEVAELFIGIFVTMIPVLAMLKAGEAGAFGAVVRSVTGPNGEPLPWACFWVTGILSSFLDNAPTYLVFFNLAGGDASVLMTRLAGALAAISAGAVFMGAMTYIGNAPNFMVKAIAESRGVRMPGFFGYMAWSGVVLVPLFLIVTIIWFL